MAMWNDYEKIARRLDRIANAFERIANALETANIIEADRKTEPQTEVEEICDRADRNCNECWKQLHCRAKDTPQTENVVGNKATLTIKDGVVKVAPQTDCGWK